MKEKSFVWNLAVSAMLLALGLVLPFFTGQIPQVGAMLLPMHIPTLLCGLICGWKYGAAVGLVMPLLRSVLFGAPPMYPKAIAMAFELAAYGGVAGFLYGRSKWRCLIALYRSLLTAMVAGRLVWGAAKVCLLGLGESGFTWEMFLAGALLNAIPGIVLQLILIPAIMVALNRTGLVPFSRKAKAEKAGL